MCIDQLGIPNFQIFCMPNKPPITTDNSSSWTHLWVARLYVISVIPNSFSDTYLILSFSWESVYWWWRECPLAFPRCPFFSIVLSSLFSFSSLLEAPPTLLEQLNLRAPPPLLEQLNLRAFYFKCITILNFQKSHELYAIFSQGLLISLINRN